MPQYIEREAHCGHTADWTIYPQSEECSVRLPAEIWCRDAGLKLPGGMILVSISVQKLHDDQRADPYSEGGGYGGWTPRSLHKNFWVNLFAEWPWQLILINAILAGFNVEMILIA